MKKLFLVSIIVFGVLTTANAQFYAGAGFSIRSSGSSESYGTSSFGLYLSPEFGFIVNPRFNVGVNLSTNISGTSSVFNDLDYKNNTYSYEFAPYVRFSVVSYNKFALQLQSDIFASGSKQTQNIDGRVYTNESNLNFGLRVAPRLSYDISRHFILFTKLNFLGFRFTTSIDRESDEVRVGFDLFGNTSNIINLDGLSIGMLYVF